MKDGALPSVVHSIGKNSFLVGIPQKCFPWVFFFFFGFGFLDVLGWRREGCCGGWLDHASPVYADKVPALARGSFHGASAFYVNEFSALSCCFSSCGA